MKKLLWIFLIQLVGLSAFGQKLGSLVSTNAVYPTNTIPVTANGRTYKVALSDLANGMGGATNFQANVLNLSLNSPSIIAGAGTASITLNTNLYFVALSGSSANFDLPALPDSTNGYWFNIQGTNTSGGVQIITLKVATVVTTIMRPEIGIAVSTITNNSGASFFLSVYAANGVYYSVHCIGDALSFSSASGWRISGTTNSVLQGIGSANDLVGTNTVTAGSFIGIGSSKGYWDFFTLNPTNKNRVTIADNGFASDFTNTLPQASGTFVMDTNTATLTNKRIVPRQVLVGDGVSINPNADTTDIVTQANTQAAGTLTIANPSGTPDASQKLVIRIKSTNAQTLAYGTQYRFSVDLPKSAFPTTTGGGAYDYIVFLYNSIDNKWDCLSKNFGF